MIYVEIANAEGELDLDAIQAIQDDMAGRPVAERFKTKPEDDAGVADAVAYLTGAMKLPATKPATQASAAPTITPGQSVGSVYDQVKAIAAQARSNQPPAAPISLEAAKAKINAALANMGKVLPGNSSSTAAALVAEFQALRIPVGGSAGNAFLNVKASLARGNAVRASDLLAMQEAITQAKAN